MPELCHSKSFEVTTPGSDADLTQIPLTDQASSGCCSSIPSKLAWLVETGLQYVLQGLPGYSTCCSTVIMLPPCCRRLHFCTLTWNVFADC